MVLEISMYFDINQPLSEFWYHFPISFSFHIALCYFLHSIYRGECAEQNSLGLWRRSLMVLEISIYFEKTISEFWYNFPIFIFFSTQTLLFFALHL